MSDTRIRLRTEADLTAIKNLDAAFQALDKDQQKAAQTALNTARDLARLDAVAGNAAQGANKLRQALAQSAGVNLKQGVSALEQITKLETSAAREADRLAAAQAKAAAAAEKQAKIKPPVPPALPRTFAGFTGGGLAQAAGAFGLLNFGPQVVGQVISFGVEQGKAALALRETQNSLKAVAGDQQTYNTVLSAARQQQVLFGGTLQENIEGLQGLAITARSSGASLTTLIDLSKRLAVLDPAQGAGGARIALNEALSGDPTSLAKRYEIPRAALAKLRDTSLPVEERLKVIDSFLSNVGITSESVAGKVDQSAVAFRSLSAELGTLTTNAGGGLADFFAKPAEGLSRLIGLINGNPEAIAKLQALISGKGTVTQEDIAGIQRSQAASKADLQLSPSRTGDPFASEATRTQPDLSKASADASRENAAAVAVLKDQLTELNLAGGDAAARAQELADKWLANTISADQFRIGVQALADQQNRGRDIEEGRVQTLNKLRGAESELVLGTLAQIDTMGQSAEKSAVDSAAKEAQAANTALVGEKTRLVVDAFLSLNPTIDASAAASLAAAQGYSPQIQQLIALGAEARNAKRDLAALSGAGSVTEGRSERDTPADRAAGRTAGIRAGQDRAAAAEQARRDQIRQTGTVAQKVALDQLELQEAQAKYGKGSAEAISAQTRLMADRQSTAKSHTSELNKQLSLQEGIYDSLNKQRQAEIDIRQLTAENTLKTLDENKQLRSANAVLNKPNASAEARTRAQAIIDKINADRDERRLKLEEAGATAGGSIVNGRLLQSRPGGAAPPAGASGTIPAGAGPAPQAAPGSSGGSPLVLTLDGREVGKIILPFVLDDLLTGVRQVRATQGA